MSAEQPTEINHSTSDLHKHEYPRWLSPVLMSLATLLAVVSVFSTWVKVQALDTDSWVSLSDQLLAEPEVQEALSTFLVDQLFSQLGLTGQIQESLPENLKGLAGPLAASMRAPVTSGAERLVASEEFRSTWLAVNRTAHQALVNILRDETRPGISTADGAVTLELGELVKVVGQQLGLSDSLLDRLPEDAGRVTVFESEQLKTAQSTVRMLDFLSWFLMLLVIVLYAAAVYVAIGRRLMALRNVGLSLIGAGLAVLAFQAVTLRILLDGIIGNPGRRPLAEVAAYVATGLVRQMAWSGVFCGLLIAGFAALLGTRSWARATRRFVAPMLNASNGAVAAGTVGLVLLALWWSPGRVFDRWITAVTVVAVMIGGVIAICRSTRDEFPDVTFDEIVASIKERFSGSDSRSAGTASELQKLRDLHASGALDDNDYAQAKQRVLAG